MAHISAETAKKIRNALKKEFPNLKLKVSKDAGSYSLNVTIVSGDIDFNEVVPNCYYQGELVKEHGYDYGVNQFWFESESHGYTQTQKDVFKRIFRIIKTEGEWYDNSDIQTDYFDTAFYFNLKVGSWDKPYVKN